MNYRTESKREFNNNLITIQQFKDIRNHKLYTHKKRGTIIIGKIIFHERTYSACVNAVVIETGASFFPLYLDVALV